MESPISNPVAKDFQVAGISRSGRVRKKSSKLLDFESPEEIEKRAKRPGRQPARYPGRGRPPNALREREQELALAYEEDEEEDDDDLVHNHSIVDDHDTVPTIGGTADLRGALMNSDDEVDTLVQDLVEGVEAEASFTNDSRVRQSLYMREKTNNKRKLLKDNKLQRKDKVRVRYTAYSLWAREVRKRDFPDMDFASAARRFSELWANVSNKEKNAWRRKAKILATKARSRDKNAPTDVATTPPPSRTSNGTATVTPAASTTDTFVNRATTSRTKKLAADRRQMPEQVAGNSSTPSTWAQSRQKRTAAIRAKASPVTAESQAGPSPTHATRQNTVLMDVEQTSGKGSTSIEAIDAAAHLKLLGESLTVIGERLKEHNGHVALSGSLSVLLDSLLCSMGPLLCMTTQIPGLENKKQLSTNLATTLDNIAYVMPGL